MGPCFCIHLPPLYVSFHGLFEKRIGQVPMELLYIRFTHQTKENQRGVPGLAMFGAVDEPISSCMMVHF